ncbi:MAG: amino acid aminotransferase [Pseudomonadota bacterium]
MTNPLSAIQAMPPDPLLGIMAAFRADDRANKVDLGVGIYKDDDGRTPIMAAVREAEKRLAVSGDTKAYEGPRGNLAFCETVQGFLYGASGGPADGAASFMTTPGGCGALGVGAAFLRRLAPERKLWISDPTWPNHVHIAKSAGLNIARYPYVADSQGLPDFDRVEDDLRQAEAGDSIIIQGPCHNPSGVDLTLEQWSRLATLCQSRGLLPFVDIAYHGFGASLDEDLVGVRTFLASVESALVSYSCSKNFGLYRERTGCVAVQAPESEAADAAVSHLADLGRASYSMPPAHGAAIVAEIRQDEALYASWVEELDGMRGRLNRLRSAFADALTERTGDGRHGAIARQAGMFSLLPVQPDAAERLAADHAVYMPKSGRINIAGLHERTIDRVADAVAPFLTA